MRKKILFILPAVLFALLTAAGNCSAQTADSTVATQFISLNDQGKYTEAAKLMAPSFLAMVSPDNLEKIWHYHVEPHGMFHGVVSVKQMQQGKIFAVFPTCLYDKADITFAFAFDDNHQIAGFHVDTIAPAGDATPAPKAIYEPAGHAAKSFDGH
jgi:hypothetical protein